MSTPVAGVSDPPAVPAPRRLVAGVLRAVVTLAAVAAAGAGAYVSRDRWLPVLFPAESEKTAAKADDHGAAGPAEEVLLSEQAQKNLKLTSQALKTGPFWKTISVPGIVVDRPGAGDRGVIAPTAGVVSRIHRVAGDAVRPGEVLFSLKLLSESLHTTQTELFKAALDIKVARAQRDRLAGGSVPEARVIEVDAQIARLEVAVRAYRQDLLTRGLPAAAIDAVAEGTFATDITVAAPARPADPVAPTAVSVAAAVEPPAAEIQEVKVELGQLVQAGQTLCLLANHRALAVEGRAFRDESPLLERTVKEGWPVEIDFGEEPGHGWDALNQTFRVTYTANTIDPDSRTFRFLLPLDNQSRTVDQAGTTRTLWRFRPGQRVRLLIRSEKLEDVFVLPAAAVVRDAADAYVFRRNGDTFERKPVQVVYQNARHAVLADDGSVSAGVHVAQTGAAQLNRMLKSQTSTAPKGFHIHADGSVHSNDHK